jgi:hypothetical protein
MSKNEASPIRDIRQVQQDAAARIAAAQAAGDLATAQSVLQEFSEQMRSFREHFESIEKTLGKNFLGIAAWKKIEIDVGEAPPFPEALTLELLNSECSLHPGQKIKDTHVLVIVPKLVNGEPYSALKLDEICARLGFKQDGWSGWKKQEWASMPQQESEWILTPKSDPDSAHPQGDTHHFRNKSIAEQDLVQKNYYPEYLEAKAIEFMTTLVLYSGVNDVRLSSGSHLRCQEPCTNGGRVCVAFDAGRKMLDVGDPGGAGAPWVGRALARDLAAHSQRARRVT